jgi:hypothetical protein
MADQILKDRTNQNVLLDPAVVCLPGTHFDYPAGMRFSLADKHYCLGLTSSDIEASNQAAAAVFDSTTPGHWKCAPITETGLADFWPLLPPETFSGSIHDRKSRAHARISSGSPGCPKPEGLDGVPTENLNPDAY